MGLSVVRQRPSL
ncbi:hypothetical protein MTR67_051378 [Solanum verrucosum]|uniref:Uncharacterized protein n=1 Tax=Solanum verrucosum TaxID=315347 RepID=A0AAF1A221_SOLVR|nr:hypothetical protein MTR67_051378 [Solanum verrucosum]